MIIDFEDDCWSHDDDDWRRRLCQTLVILERREQHQILATADKMLPWCDEYLNLSADYFKSRLASAQPRTNALTLIISPFGASSVAGPPPWRLTTEAVFEIVNQPLKMYLENDESDLKFVASAIPSFSRWRERGWVEPAMGGGSAMRNKITIAGADAVKRWRTFFLFDSDRLHQDELLPGWTPTGGDSCQGQQFEVACAAMPNTRWHRLKRRSIENYLPPFVLNLVNPALAALLISNHVANMANFYNMKEGLRGDGVSPQNANKAARAARSRGFWTSLAPAEIATLEPGFGNRVSDQFAQLSSNHPWPTDVSDEILVLADGLQDAM